MKETNLMSSPRLIGRCCLKEYLYSKTTLMLLIFMLPMAIFSQELDSQEYKKLKEANHQAWLKQQNANQPVEITEQEEQQLLEEQEYQMMLKEFGIEEQKYFDKGLTKADILSEVDKIRKERQNLNTSTLITTNPTLTDGMMSRSGGGDYCSTAVVLECGVPAIGDSYGAYNAGVTMCGGAPNDGTGMWYKFTGNGAMNNFAITASTGAAAQIRLYTSGDGTCSSLQCASISGQGTTSISNFYAPFEDTIYVLVSSFAGAGGTYTIERTSAGECFDTPPGDGLTAATAYPIACGDVATGSTVGASPTQVPSYCGTSPSDYGVWYTYTAVAGTPEDLSFRTCNSDYDSKINVYTGTPESLVCVGGDDDDYSVYCYGNDGFVDLTTNIDVTYYIYVSGWSSSVGNYELTVVCDGDAVTPPPAAPANDLCADATQLLCGDILTDGTTVSANVEVFSDCYYGINGADVWYYVEGNGNPMNVIVTPETEEAQVEIYESFGSCGDFSVGSCFAYDSYGSPSGPAVVSWTSEVDKFYYIRVVGAYTSTDPFDFSIEMECLEPILNDDCDGAELIGCGDVVNGNMIGATVSSIPYCGTSSHGPGVWYKLIGTGDPIILDTNGSSMYHRIFVYTGSCDGLICEDYEYGGSSGSQLALQTVDQEEYYIHLSATYTSTTLGDFVLEAYCPPDPCETATPLSCEDGTVYGSNSGASGSVIGPGDVCDNVNTPGVFYVLSGSDQVVTINTCGSNYDTNLNVFSGACGTFECVTQNDDWQDSYSECGSSFRSRVQFWAASGTDYYIWVNGYNGASGDFQLNISCDDPVGNDLCADAISVGCGESISGSTTLATDRDTPGIDCSGDETSEQGVWYEVIGTGGEMTVSVCETDFNAKLLIYSGNCGEELTCVHGNDNGYGCGLYNQPTITFESESGLSYKVFVTGSVSSLGGTDVGSFEFSVDCACYNPTGDDTLCYTIYDGYYDNPDFPQFPASVTLEPEMMYGEAPITYAWSDGSTGSTLLVEATVDGEFGGESIPTSNYSVVMTDASGCSTYQEYYVYVVDVNCDTKGTDKVTVCHNGTAICVADEAVASHLSHGDTLGYCDTIIDCSLTVPSCDVTLTSGTEDLELNTTLTWAAGTGIVTYYNVTVVDAADVEIVNTDVVGLSVDVTLPEYSSDYYVTITPYNDNGSPQIACEATAIATGLDPSTIVCGEVNNFTYCYGAYENTSFQYSSFDGSPLAISFNDGFIESASWDHLRIYDGEDASGTLIWENGYSSIYDLSTIGEQVAQSGHIFMTITSDGYVHCSSSSSYSSMDWNVYCASTPPPASYCNSEFTSGNWEYITGFQLNTINNPSGFEGYGDFTGLSTNLAIGSTYNFTISAIVDSSEGYAIWIDYNQDADFDDAGEQVFLQAPTSANPITGSFTVPAGATPGATRLRVMQDWLGIVGPCTSDSFGETEDYTVNIVSGARPSANIVSSPIDWSMAPNPTKGNVTLDLTNYLQSDVTIDVMSVTGKVIYNASLQNLKGSKYEVELNNSLPAGMYFVRVAASGQVSTKKLMIMR